MLECINNLEEKLKNDSNSFFMSRPYFAYFSCYQGEFYLTKELRSINSFFMLRVKTYCKIIIDGKLTSLSPGVYTLYNICADEIKVMLREDCQCLMFDLRVFKGFCEANPEQGIQKSSHESMLCSLLDELNHEDMEINEILAIINLSVVPKKFIENDDYRRIRMAMEQNYNNRYFSLASLSDGVFMSERKIQQRLKENNTTYRKLLKDIRYKKLIHLINSSGGCESAKYYAIKSGFPNLQSGNCCFQEHHGVSVKTYIKNCRRYFLRDVH